MMSVLPIVIELGNFQLRSATPWNEVGWFVTGLALLTALTIAVLWSRRRARPDPFL
ncbi:MAG TPA: hypothetical protein VK879_06805 [Candidatus Sulfomarinibacteraceae bacterium]|nr:hypothetical protein [Candidatus Sulfomarinibacteraceae bacterium]